MNTTQTKIVIKDKQHENDKQYEKITYEMVNGEMSILNHITTTFLDMKKVKNAHTVYMFSSKITDEDLKDTKMNVLHLYQDPTKNRNITDEGIKQLCNNENLETLYLSCKTMTDESLKYLHNVKNLYLYNMDQITDEGMKQLSETDTLLQTLNIYNCSNLSCKEISKINSIKSLCITNTPNKLSDLEFVSNMTNLKTLIYDLNNFEVVKELKQLCYCHNLHTIVLSNSSYIIEGDIKQLCGVRNLKNLDINYCRNISNKDIRYLCEKLPRLKSLKTSYHLTDEDCDYLCNLNKLIMFDCQGITDEGLKQFNDNLEVLCLYDCNNITDEGIKHLSDNCPNLSKICIQYCSNITRKGENYMIEMIGSVCDNVFLLDDFMNLKMSKHEYLLEFY